MAEFLIQRSKQLYKCIDNLNICWTYKFKASTHQSSDFSFANALSFGKNFTNSKALTSEYLWRRFFAVIVTEPFSGGSISSLLVTKSKQFIKTLQRVPRVISHMVLWWLITLKVFSLPAAWMKLNNYLKFLNASHIIPSRPHRNKFAH